ncbi:MAG TPA: DUF1579 domain-containing protein [Thermoanaerobaculia bacterium]
MRLRQWCAWTFILFLVAMPMVAAELGEDNPAQKKDEKPAAMPAMSEEDMAYMQAMMKAGEVTDNHKGLAKFAGEWETKATFWMKPGAEPMVSTGKSVNKLIFGGRFVEQRFSGDMMGQPFEGIGYTGYDNIKEKFVGTWMDSMGTGVMSSLGSADKEGGWTFSAFYDDPMTRKTVEYKEKIKVVDDHHHIFEMWGPDKSGTMFKMMEIHYTRAGSAH